jgi:hypothetical protein
MDPERSHPHAPPVAGNGPPAAGGATFRREGQYWTIVYRGTVARLRDAKGLRYLAHLLARPGECVPARDLLAIAKAEHPRPVTAAEEPPGAGDAERERLAVTKRIKGAIRTIDSYSPELGYHLTVTIRTGSKCVYLAHPERPLSWAT